MQKHLFENAYYLLVFNQKANKKAAEKIQELLKSTLAKFIFTDANEHDFVTGIVSHVPHIVASSLVHLSADHVEKHHLVQQLAAGGFRDITRIASSNAEMWKDITLNNKTFILDILEDLQNQISSVMTMISSSKSEDIYQFLLMLKTTEINYPLNNEVRYLRRMIYLLIFRINRV